jgi:MinD-like ATPase involved in chromosome partitioning or flagellar assembly
VIGERVGVLLAASSATWEIQALRVLGAPPAGAVVLKRCVDLADLLATAATGQARAAVVAAALPGLDADSVAALRRSGVAVVVVAEPGPPGGNQLAGVHETLSAHHVGTLGSVVSAAAASADEPAEAPGGSDTDAGPLAGPRDEEAVREPGRVVSVWGPTGAPGRTTVAVNLAAELASRGHDTLLVDADGYGGAVAQHLGVLDEVSGLLSAVRLANTGQLDVPRLASVARSAGRGLRVLTGLPRTDRWPEVRPAPFDTLLETARSLSAYVVLDLGFGLEQEASAYGSSAPQRNHMTVAGLDHADDVVVVGGADPVGLARLARGLVDLPEAVPAATTRVVVNRVRASLGWGEHEVRAMVEGFLAPASMHFLPDDSAAVDRALVAGRPLLETGRSPLTRALADLADCVAGESPATQRRPVRLRRRGGGRGR